MSTSTPWLEGLNEAQRQAVTYGDGPLLVIAGAGMIALEQNYRSTGSILVASNTVMEQARERYKKNLWSLRPAVIGCMCKDERLDQSDVGPARCRSHAR